MTAVWDIVIACGVAVVVLAVVGVACAAPPRVRGRSPRSIP